MNSLNIGDSLLFAAGTQFLICLIIAEALYPDYNVSTNSISDLGATCNSICAIHQPSAFIFNSSVFVLGILALIGSYAMYSRYTLPAVLMMIGSIGAMGVGVFTETTRTLHLVFSGIAFLFTGLSAITSYRLSKFPMSYFSIILGVMVLLPLIVYASGTFFGSGHTLGQGELERLIAYPAVIWVIGIGSHLIGRTGH